MDKLALYFYYLSVFKELKIVDVIKERLKLCVQERGLCCLKVILELENWQVNIASTATGASSKKKSIGQVFKTKRFVS